MEKERKISNEQRIFEGRNKVAVIGFTIINVVLAIAYLIEVFKGERKLVDYLIIFILTIAPTVWLWILYIKNRASNLIQYVGTWCFVVLYAYIMFTTDKLMVFSYMLLVMTLFMVYENKKNIMYIGIAALIINIGAIIKIYATGQEHITNTSEVEIDIACMLLMGCCTTLVTSLNASA